MTKHHYSNVQIFCELSVFAKNAIMAYFFIFFGRYISNFQPILRTFFLRRERVNWVTVVAFSSENGLEWNSEVFLNQKWFGMEFPGFFSSEKWFGMEFRGFVASEKWFGTEFRSFSLTRNGQNSDGTVVCSVLFRITQNNFFVGKWQP